MNIKTLCILAALFVAYAFVSNMDYEDTLLAHGQNAAECEPAIPAPDTGKREDA